MRIFVAILLLGAAAAGTLHAQDWDRDRRWRHRDGLQIRIGRSYHLPADQIAAWPVVVVGGSATIDGRVDDDLVVIGGSVHIGPTAQVRANVVVVGGEAHVADTAQISGEVHDVSMVWPEIRFALRDWMWQVDRGWWAGLTMVATVFRFTLVLVGACLLALVAPRGIRRIEERVADAPLASAFVGLAAQILAAPFFLIVIAGLVLTIIGIPLLVLVPFALLAFLLAWLAGFTAVAARLGGALRGRTGLATPDSGAIDTAWGVLLLFVVSFTASLFAFGPPWLWPFASMLGVAGFIIECIAWTVGLGAALLTPLRARSAVGPPPVPSAASANA